MIPSDCYSGALITILRELRGQNTHYWKKFKTASSADEKAAIKSQILQNTAAIRQLERVTEVAYSIQKHPFLMPK